MRHATLAACSVFALAAGAAGCSTQEKPMKETPALASATATAVATSLHALTVERLDGTKTALSAWAGKVLLIVNTASECGFTPQYEGLETLQQKYEGRGFSVLGFPSNDFGEQEPGSAEQIAAFCRSKYGVTFPMFQKVKTVGPERAPLYALLTDAKGAPEWNFHKYLVDKKGLPLQAWPSRVTPSSPEIAAAIERALAAP